MLNFNID